MYSSHYLQFAFFTAAILLISLVSGKVDCKGKAYDHPAKGWAAGMINGVCSILLGNYEPDNRRNYSQFSSILKRPQLNFAGAFAIAEPGGQICWEFTLFKSSYDTAEITVDQCRAGFQHIMDACPQRASGYDRWDAGGNHRSWDFELVLFLHHSLYNCVKVDFLEMCTLVISTDHC